MRETPQEIYERAIQERKSSNALNRRQACEKGWLAVTEAVDAFLAMKGKTVEKGKADTHVNRVANLADLVNDGISGAARLLELHSIIAEQLHGACFYAGKDHPHFTNVLEKDVKKVLELTGFWTDGAEG